MTTAAINWIPVTPGGPRPEGFALWLVPVRNGPKDATATEVHYARADPHGLVDAWGDDAGWRATDATHYAEIGHLPETA